MAVTIAKAGTLDIFFGTKGLVNLGIAFIATVFQIDGKLVGVRNVNGAIAINRYNSNGTPDTSFGKGGAVQTNFGSPHDTAISVTVSSTGKIVVLATTELALGPHSDAYTFMVLARYNIDGILDTSFGVGGVMKYELGPSVSKISISPDKLYIQNDGKIVVTLLQNVSSGGSNKFETQIIRFDSQGKTNFAQSITAGSEDNYAPTSLLVQTDGKIVIGGYNLMKNPFKTTTKLMLCRLNNNGTKDAVFGSNGMVTTDVSENVVTIASQKEKILVSAIGNKLLRFDNNGTKDSSFGVITTNLVVRNIIVQNDSKIITGGGVNGNFALARFSSDGKLDTNFGAGGMVTSDFGSSKGVENMTIFSKRLYAYGAGILASYHLSDVVLQPL